MSRCKGLSLQDVLTENERVSTWPSFPLIRKIRPKKKKKKKNSIWVHFGLTSLMLASKI